MKSPSLLKIPSEKEEFLQIWRHSPLDKNEEEEEACISPPSSPELSVEEPKTKSAMTCRLGSRGLLGHLNLSKHIGLRTRPKQVAG